MSATARVWFHRSRSIVWLIVAVLALPFGWLNSVVLVSLASLYANVASDWSASEAADDREVVATLRRIEQACRPRAKLRTARPTWGRAGRRKVILRG